MRICVIFNPKARGERAQQLHRHLDGLSNNAVLRPTAAPGEGRLLAAEAVREGFDTIVAAGGDGTVNEVVNGLADEPEGCARARLAVLPVGTVNVFAREVGLPLRLENAWSVLQRGRETVIDLPRMEFAIDGEKQSRCFIQMAGAGWDARAIEGVSWRLKRRIGQFAYVVAGLRILAHPQPQLTVSSDLGSQSGELVIIGNGRYYGGQIPIFSQADLRDGLLDVCLFPRVHWFVLLRYAWAYLTRGRLRPGEEHYFQTKTLKMECAVRTPFELDGENVGCLPARCSIQPQALRVIVPEPTA